MRVYVITCGDYSSYHIVGVTLDKAKAETWVQTYNDHRDYDFAQVEEFDADDFGRDGIYCYDVEQDGSEVVVKLADASYDFYDCIWSKKEWEVRVFAKDKDSALKAAYDKVAQMMAREAGL